MKAMILAAGRGERMASYSGNVPKPLVKLDEHSLIEHQIMKLAAAGFHEIVINLSYQANLIREALGDGSRWKLRLHYSHEPSCLDTGGGIKHALPYFERQAFVVVSADLATDFPYQTLNQITLGGEHLGHLILVPNPPHNPAGDFALLDNGLLSRSNPIKYNFAGISVFHPHLSSNTPKPSFHCVRCYTRPSTEGKLAGVFTEAIGLTSTRKRD